MRQASAPTPLEPSPLPVFLFLHFNSSKTTQGRQKTAELHKTLPVLLFPFQHAQNSSVICITYYHICY
jgi:hypothetical protein